MSTNNCWSCHKGDLCISKNAQDFNTMFNVYKTYSQINLTYE